MIMQVTLSVKLIQHAILTERPTVPRPKMTTVDPSDTSATFHAAPKPKIESQLLLI